MTISHEVKQDTGVSAYFALCRGCKVGDGVGKHFAMIHSGYGEDAEPITDSDIEVVEALAHQHNKQTRHEIVIYHYIP